MRIVQEKNNPSPPPSPSQSLCKFLLYVHVHTHAHRHLLSVCRKLFVPLSHAEERESSSPVLLPPFADALQGQAGQPPEVSRPDHAAVGPEQLLLRAGQQQEAPGPVGGRLPPPEGALMLAPGEEGAVVPALGARVRDGLGRQLRGAGGQAEVASEHEVGGLGAGRGAADNAIWNKKDRCNRFCT